MGRRFLRSLWYLWLAMACLFVAGEVKDDIGPHQIVRLGKALLDSECRFLLWALDQRMEGKRPTLEKPDLGTGVVGDERPCPLRLFEWWHKNKDKASTVVVSSALRDVGRHDLSIELLKNIGQDKMLAFNKVVLNYKQNLEKAGPKSENHPGVAEKELIRLRRQAADRGELVYAVKKKVRPPCDSLSARLRPLLHGLAYGFVAAAFAGALVSLLAGGIWARGSGRERAVDGAARHRHSPGEHGLAAPLWDASRVRPLECPVHPQHGGRQHHAVVAGVTSPGEPAAQPGDY